MKEVILVPTSHVASQSLKAVRKTIEEKKPDCVAVELDINRYYAMKNEKTASGREVIRAFGLMNFLVYWLMKNLQKSLGEKTGIIPGSEMVGAVDIASENHIKVAFIDRDIGLTFARMSRIPWSERLKLAWFLVKGFLAIIFSKIYKGKHVFDLSKVPPKQVIDEAMALLRREFPNIHRVLVSERDEIMASKIINLTKEFDCIVVVAGAGHYDGLRKRLA
jgi:pheromone shutdown-related protein TraB